MDRMRDTIWKFVGGVSAMSGLICFGLSPTYKVSFGKWGILGLLVYLLISAITLWLVYFGKRIQVPKIIQVVVEAILFVAFYFISFELHELVPGKSDALGIISYGFFALMSLYTSRESELEFDTGCFSFFLTLFLDQFFKTNGKLLPIGLVFCWAAIYLRPRSQSASPNGEEVVSLINATATATGHHVDFEMGQVPGESVSSTNDEQNNPEESSQAVHHPSSNIGGVSKEPRSSFPTRHRLPSNDGRVSEGNISDGGNEQNNEPEEDSTSTLAAESSYSSEQGHVSSANPPQQIRRRRTPATQSNSSGIEGSPSGSGNGRIKLVLIEGRDLVAAHLSPFVRARYGIRAERTKVILGTSNPTWNKTLEFPDDGSRLILYVRDYHTAAPTEIDKFELEYRSFPLNRMVDMRHSLKLGRGEIHFQITRIVPEMPKKPSLDAEPFSSHSHQIPTQIKERRLKDGTIEGPSTSFSELETQEDTEEV